MNKPPKEIQELHDKVTNLLNEGKAKEAWELLSGTSIPREYLSTFKALAGVAVGLWGNVHESNRLLREAYDMGLHTYSLFVNLSRSYQIIGDVTSALEFAKLAWEERPCIRMAFQVGFYHELLGQSEAAIKWYKLHENFSLTDDEEVYYRASILEKLGDEQQAVKILEKKVRGIFKVPLRMNSWYLLGELYHSLDDPDRAWASWSKGNELNTHITGPADFKQLNSMLAQYARLGMNSPTLHGDTVFIVGMPRVGSTLLEHLLVGCGGGPLQEWDQLNQEVVRRGGWDWFEWASPDELTRCGSRFLDAEREYAGEKDFYIDKTLPNWHRIPAIYDLFAAPKIIHLTRNPMDVALSCFRHQFMTHKYCNNISDIWRVLDLHGSIMASYKDRYPDILTVSYEEFVEQPKESMEELCEKLDLPFDPDSLNTNRPRPIHTIKGSDVFQPITTSRRDQWKPYKKYLKP